MGHGIVPQLQLVIHIKMRFLPLFLIYGNKIPIVILGRIFFFDKTKQYNQYLFKKISSKKYSTANKERFKM